MENKATNNTPLKYLSEHPEFTDFIVIAAKEINLSPEIIEKDYWVTRVLRAFALSDFKDEVVFKGGTCLSKAYKIIDRFSEDIDLLLTPTANTGSNNQKKRRLVDLRDFVANIEGLTYVEETSMKRQLFAKFNYSYNFNTSGDYPSSVSPHILLEPGYRGGTVPGLPKCKINSLLAEYILQKGVKDLAEDLEPFELFVLPPERIFIEKLDAIRCSFNNGGLKQKTRHYYDIYKLLDNERIQNLQNSPDLITLILDDISAISEEYFNLTEKIKLSDMKDCPAFDPDFSEINDLSRIFI